MIDGIILKGIGGFYTVKTACDELTCKAAGRFRREHMTPLVGDIVRVEQKESGYSLITEILPRKNQLIRPSVANIDKLLIVVSASLPHPDYLLLDKLILNCELLGIAPMLAVNKSDCDDKTVLTALKSEYGFCGYPIVEVSAHTKKGREELLSMLRGSVTCLAGQSAVGKSSILNMLLPRLALEVGEVSAKTEHGRHTTRLCTLMPLEQNADAHFSDSDCIGQASAFFEGGAVFDTPGFSLLENFELDPKKLSSLYPEMREIIGCRFTSCMHLTEPDCAVKPLVGVSISEKRYERYKLFAAELKEAYGHRYS